MKPKKGAIVDESDLEVKKIDEIDSISELKKFLADTNESSISDVEKLYTDNELLEIIDKNSYYNKNFSFKVNFEQKTKYSDEQLVKIEHIFSNLDTTFKELKKTNTQYAYYKEYNYDNFKVNEIVNVMGITPQVKIIFVFDSNVIVSYNNQSLTFEKKDVRFPERSNKLKLEHIQEIYDKCYEKLFDEVKKTEIEFFSVFCDYFCIDEKVLYENISMENQKKLLNELNEKTGFLKTKKFKNWKV